MNTREERALTWGVMANEIILVSRRSGDSSEEGFKLNA